MTPSGRDVSHGMASLAVEPALGHGPVARVSVLRYRALADLTAAPETP